MVLTITMCICGGTLYGVAQSINIEKRTLAVYRNRAKNLQKNKIICNLTQLSSQPQHTRKVTCKPKCM